MLIQFSVTNYKTFKDKATLSLVASNYDKDTRVAENIVVNEKYNLRLLKSAVIYGPNASGKTKLFDAMNSMKAFLLRSYEWSLKEYPLPVEPFKLNTKSEMEPTEFEVIFLYKNILYRYGFEANQTQVISEWLYYKPKTKETELFYREGEDITSNKTQFLKGDLIKREKLLRKNVLLLSLAASLNDEIAKSIIDWLEAFNSISGTEGTEEKIWRFITLRQMENEANKKKVLDFIQSADLGINDIRMKTIKDLKSESIFPDVLTFHKKYDENKHYTENVSFTLDKNESSGTQKFLSISGVILNCLKYGRTLLVDELDSKLHPNLVAEIISLFNSAEKNPNNAQLIFNTHNTNLLSSRLFRRDQVWFTQKNRMGEASLYSLADFKTDQVRKDEAFEDNYIRGKYGAIPYLDAFEDLNIHKMQDYADEE